MLVVDKYKIHHKINQLNQGFSVVMPLITFFKKLGVRSLLSALVIVIMLLHATDVIPLSFISKLEQFSYDVRLNLLMPNSIDNRIVIVDIDEKSLKEQGQWPWSRNKLALLVNQLFTTYRINTLGFDVVFAEKDESSGLKNLEWMQEKYLKEDARFNQAMSEIRPLLDYDTAFANSLKNRKVVLGYYFLLNGDKQHIGRLPEPIFNEKSFENATTKAIEVLGYGSNLDILQSSARTSGHFSLDPSADGVTRKIPMLIKFEGNYYDSLSVAVARTYLDASYMQANFEKSGRYLGLESFKIKDKIIPVDAEISSLIPYRGRQGSFHYVSATDVLSNKVPARVLKDKIVLVGTTAAGLLDLRATPVQGAYPGVEVHANMIAGIIDNKIKKRPAYTLGTEFALLLLAGLLLMYYLPKYNPLMATLFTLAVLIVVLGIVLVSWQYVNLVIPTASLLLMIGLIYFMNMSYGFFVESNAKRQLARMFGQYVPPELVREMAENPERISLVGESREMTVLFTDIRGFTTISESLDPKQLTELMGEFLTPLTQIIHYNRGTIDKYIGDAIMAFWGAPLQDKRHAMHALKTAFEMQTSLLRLNEKFMAKGWPSIQIGIGLNTGNMVVGNMGSSFRMAYTVMGDAVNLGARVESLTKYYGADIIVTEYVKAQAPDFVYRELDIVRVKGKDEVVRIYEPVGMSGQIAQQALDELTTFEAAIKLYRSRQWVLAEHQLKSLYSRNQRRVYSVYMERIQNFKNLPPISDWDGIHTFESK